MKELILQVDIWEREKGEMQGLPIYTYVEKFDSLQEAADAVFSVHRELEEMAE